MVYRKWVKRGKIDNDWDNIRKVQNDTNKLIKSTKETYYSTLGNKLPDPRVGQKDFWNVYKKVVNKKRNTNIPPIIHDGVFISNFKRKAEIFNQYFANQCKINQNGSFLPPFSPKTNVSLSRVSINKAQIIIIINNFNANKAHGCDGICVDVEIMCRRRYLSVVKSWKKSCLIRSTNF